MRFVVCVINSLPININSRNISSRKHIIQMRRTCRSCNYLRFRTGTNLLRAFTIETTLVEKSRGFTEILSSLASLSSDTSKKKTFLVRDVFLLFHRFCDPSRLQPSCKLLSQPTEIINELIKVFAQRLFLTEEYLLNNILPASRRF